MRVTAKEKTNLAIISEKINDQSNVLNNDILKFGEAYMISNILKWIDAGIDITTLKTGLLRFMDDDENLKNMVYDLMKDDILKK